MVRKTTRLQELFHRKEIFILPGGACAVHAKLAEAVGFEAVYMSGANTAAFILGMPDAGLITMTEMVENAGRMASAVSIPVFADSDQGFGNAINVRRTVQSFIRAGVGGIQLEDQVMPKRCGFVKGKELVSLEEAVGKYRAAVDAKRELDADFVIAARCDARTAVGGGLEEAIRRLKAYKAAGVDVAFLEAAQSIEEIKTVRAEVEGPLLCTLSATDSVPSLEELGAIGLSAALFPSLLSRVGLIATWDFAKDFLRRGTDVENELRGRTQKHPLAGYGLYDLVGFPEVRKLEEEYLPREALRKYEDSVGVYDPATGAWGR